MGDGLGLGQRILVVLFDGLDEEEAASVGAEPAEAVREGVGEGVGVGDGELAGDFAAADDHVVFGALDGEGGQGAGGEVVWVGVGAHEGAAVPVGGAGGLEAVGEPVEGGAGGGVGGSVAGVAAVVEVVAGGVDGDAEAVLLSGCDGQVDGVRLGRGGEDAVGEGAEVGRDARLDDDGEGPPGEVGGGGEQDAHLGAGVGIAVGNPVPEGPHDHAVHVLVVQEGVGDVGVVEFELGDGVVDDDACGGSHGCSVGGLRVTRSSQRGARTRWWEA